MLCPKCGSKYLEGARFCGQCGYDLSSGERTCPACKAAVLPGNRFCTHCGTRVEESADSHSRSEIGEWTDALTLDQIRDLAAVSRYNALSPIAPFHDPAKKGGTGKILLDKDLLEPVLRPERAFYVTRMSPEGSFQKVLLIKGARSVLWTDEGGHVVISKGGNLKEFFETLVSEIGSGVTEGEQDLMVMTQDEIEVLKATEAFCESLEMIHVTPAFATKIQIGKFMDEGRELEPLLKSLLEKGLIRVLGRENSVIKMEEKGKQIAEALTDYDSFYSIVSLTEGSKEYPSIHLSSSRGRLYMLSNPKDGEHVLIRSIHPEGLRSILNWAWASGLSAAGMSPRPQ